MTLEILKKYHIKAKKSLGQNFLVNEQIVDWISNVIEVKDKNIIEVWPWYGALTEKLIIKKPKSLNLVELDRDMIEVLNKRIDSWDFDLDWIDFKINNLDVLKYIPENKDYSVIANIPYYITSPILRHFLYVKRKNICFISFCFEKMFCKWWNICMKTKFYSSTKSRVKCFTF